MKLYSPLVLVSILISFIIASENKYARFDWRITNDEDYLKSNVSILLGLNYSDFLLRNTKGSTNYTFGLRYEYPLNKYVSTSFGVFRTTRNIELNDKIYQNDSFSDLELYKVDIIYQAQEVYLPFGVSFSYHIINNTKLYTSIGLGYTFYSPDSEVEVQYIVEEKVDYDYYHSEGWRKPIPYGFCGVGFNKDNSNIELEVMVENKTTGRMLNTLHLLITEKLYSIQLLYGYSFSL